MTLNAAQHAHMQARYPGKELHELSAESRLEISNICGTESALEPVAELSPLQKSYLGDRKLSDISELDRKNLEWLGSFTAKVEEPTESAKPVEDDAPVIVDAHSVIDLELIKDLSPVRRAGLADALDTVRRGVRIGDSIGRITALESAKFILAPFVRRKH